ncbi:MAG: hypothetical protein R6U32_02710 [Candidatus Woesearchaeota archaeon]
MARYHKKGQLAAFIIISLAVLVMAGVLFYIKGQTSGMDEEETITMPEAASIRVQFQECFEQVSRQALIELGNRGGTFHPQEFMGDDSRIAFHYYNGSLLAPSREDAEEELGWYVKENAGACLNTENQKGVNISTGSIDSEVRVSDDKVFMYFDMPVTVRKGGEESAFSRFQSEFNIRLGRIIDIYEDIGSDMKDDPLSTDLTKLLSYDVDIQKIELGRMMNLDLFIIKDYESSFTGDTEGLSSYRFIFSAFHGGEMPALEAGDETAEPVINTPERLEAVVGERFEYRIDVDYRNPERLFYVIETDISAINPYADIINFTPQEGMEGNHTIEIKVQDVEQFQEPFISKEVDLEITG